MVTDQRQMESEADGAKMTEAVNKAIVTHSEV